MAQQTLNVGSNANDGTGDTLRAAMQKVNTMFTEVYASSLFNDSISLVGNEITATRSNDNLVIRPSGTGTVAIDKLVVDNNIQLTDNIISTTNSNSNLKLSASGTGSIEIAKADINGGAIDNTVIGGTTPAAATFTTATVNTQAVIDGITIKDNEITTNASNADLELSGNGTGTVKVAGFTMPASDGSANQLLKTDGSGNLSFATATATLNHGDISDDTTTVASSTTTQIDSFSSATYRSAKYFISITDATNGRYEMVEANVIHGPSADSTIEAYITVFGSTTSYSAPLCTFTADIDDGNVRLRATINTPNQCIFKFQRVAIDL
jgi:hypothetical protein